MLTIRRYRQTVATLIVVLTCIAVVYPLTVFAVSWAALAVVMAMGPERRARAVALAGCSPADVEWYDCNWWLRWGGWSVYSGMWFCIIPYFVPDTLSWADIFGQLFPAVPAWFIPFQVFYFGGALFFWVAVPFLQLLAYPGVPVVGVAGSRLILHFAPPLAPRVIAMSDIVSMEWKHVSVKDRTKKPSYYRLTLSDGSRFLIFPNVMKRGYELIARLKRLELTPY